jgi:hypothetical protein
MKTRKSSIVCTFFLNMALAIGITSTPKPLDAQMSIYGNISSSYANMCLQPVNGSTAIGAAVVLAPCNGGQAQEWQSMAVGSGPSSNFRNQLSGLCLDGGTAENHSPVQQMPCSSSTAASQDWAYTFESGADTPIVSALNLGAFANFCLDIPGGLATPGAAMQIYGCNGTVSQNWHYSGYYAAPSTVGVMRSVATGLCIQPTNGSASAGTPIVQEKCSGDNEPAQVWTLVNLTGRYSFYVNQLSGLCLDAIGNGTPKNHDVIVQWPCSQISNESWAYNHVASGIGGAVVSGKANSYPKFCLDVPGGQATPGLALQIYQCNQSAAQQWY